MTLRLSTFLELLCVFRCFSPLYLVLSDSTSGEGRAVFSFPLLSGTNSSPVDLPNLGIEPASLMSPALAGRFFTTSTFWETPYLGMDDGICVFPEVVSPSASWACTFSRIESWGQPGGCRCRGHWAPWGLLPSAQGKGVAQLYLVSPALHPSGCAGRQHGISVHLFFQLALSTECYPGEQGVD